MREIEEKRGWEDDLTIPEYVIWDFERNGGEGEKQGDAVPQIGP